jgi:hypothetical protein
MRENAVANKSNFNHKNTLMTLVELDSFKCTPKIGNGTPEKNNQDNKSTDDKQKTEQQQQVNQ